MGTLFILDLAYAAGVALSPTPIVVVILMLFSPSGRRNALAFLLGWVLGLAILAIVLSFLFQAGIGLLESNTIFARPGIQLLLGILVLFSARRHWNKQPKADAAAETPKWLSRLDEWLTRSSEKFTPLRAFGLAVVMSSFSLKNIGLMLAVVLMIAQANLDPFTQAFLFGIFVIISSVTIGMPVLYAVAKGNNAQDALAQWKTWVIENRGRAAALLLFVLGGILVLNGVVGIVERLAAA